MRKVLPEDIDMDAESPRHKKTKSKTFALDEFMDTLGCTIAEMSTPGNCFAIDESMIPWWGKYCPVRVFIKGKPYKYGIKLWTLADWPSGYVRNFRMYTGRGDKWPHETDESMEGWNYAERVVICLTKDLPDGCFFTVDRNFMTPKLAAWMKSERRQYGTGTMKSNTKYIDKSLLFKKSSKIPRGFYSWSENNIEVLPNFLDGQGSCAYVLGRVWCKGGGL